MAVFELDGKRCAWKDLFNAPGYFERSFLDVFGSVGFGYTRPGLSGSIATNGDLTILLLVLASQQRIVS